MYGALGSLPSWNQSQRKGGDPGDLTGYSALPYPAGASLAFLSSLRVPWGYSRRAECPRGQSTAAEAARETGRTAGHETISGDRSGGWQLSLGVWRSLLPAKIGPLKAVANRSA